MAGGYVEGIWTVWTFDDVFSQLILADHNPGGTGKIDAQANAAIKKDYFDNLRTRGGTFRTLSWEPGRSKFPVRKSFRRRSRRRGKVSYRFFLPLGVRLDAKNTVGRILLR